MVRLSYYLSLFLINFLMFVLTIPSFAQISNKITYPKAKIFMKNGQTIEGKRLIMDKEIVVLYVNGSPQAFQTYDVYSIMVKKGYASDFAYCGGGGCLALSAITLLFSYEDLTSSDSVYVETYGENALEQFILGSLIWTAIFATGGYLIGSLVDDWTPIYIPPSVSEFSNYQLASSKINKAIKLPILCVAF